MQSKKIFTLRSLENVREQLTSERLRNIKKQYEKVYENVVTELGTTGDRIRENELKQIKDNIESQLVSLNQNLEKDIKSDINLMSLVTVQEKRKYLKTIGFKESLVKNAFFYVPPRVVASISQGLVYEGDWSLSSALWGYNRKTQKTLNNIISNGAAQGKSAYDIALDLEKYVLPESKKKSRVIESWRYKDGKKVKDTFYFGNVDYNAQRLARTMISHAYQQSFEAVNKNDPFIIGYKWITSNFHGRVCEICKERASQNDYGLGSGVFPKNELPLDHPNGMCTFLAVFDTSETKIEDKIGKWIQASYGTYPEIDRFAESFLRNL